MIHAPRPVFGLPEGPEMVANCLDIAPVFSGIPVGFSLTTCGADQYVAFYDDRLQMTIGRLPYPADLIQASHEELQVNWVLDSGNARVARSRFVLRWESLPANNDRMTDGRLHEASMLRLYELAAGPLRGVNQRLDGNKELPDPRAWC
jgi:hypothetical protein